MTRERNKILAGAMEALEVARGNLPAAKITSFVGGPYIKDDRRPLIQQRVNGGYIVWNWDNSDWDSVMEPIQIIATQPSAGLKIVEK